MWKTGSVLSAVYVFVIIRNSQMICSERESLYHTGRVTEQQQISLLSCKINNIMVSKSQANDHTTGVFIRIIIISLEKLFKIKFNTCYKNT
jgi:hypothetical protein